MRQDHYNNYRSFSLEKAWELLIPPAEKRAAELREAINDPERQDVKHLLEELLLGAEEVETRFKELFDQGLYVSDWMCNRDGYFYHMDSYHRDQIEELKETIARLNELIPKVEELKVGRAEKISILTEIDYRIRKNRRLINHNKTKIFQFKLKMNKKKELHERKKKLDAEIRKMEASRDGSETKKIIGRTRKARSTNC